MWHVGIVLSARGQGFPVVAEPGGREDGMAKVSRRITGTPTTDEKAPVGFRLARTVPTSQ